MNWLAKIVQFISPDLVLEGTTWEQEWRQSQRDRFVKVARVFFMGAGLGYVLHYFLYDKPYNLQPIESWFAFRASAAAMCLACFIFYLSPFSRISWYRWPGALAMSIGCYAQAEVTLAHPEAPWIYPYVFVFAATLILQTTPIKSLTYALLTMATFVSPLLQAGVDFNDIWSATFFTALVAVVTRGAYHFELQSFVLTQEKDEQKQELIKMEKEFSGRLKSFIPRVIAGRIQEKIDSERMSVLEATVNVLSARRQNVACLFSDIRGFTQGSKDIDSFLVESVVPEIKACSDAVEEFDGIPRKIGDLIFAYFDSSTDNENLVKAVLAGISLSRLNEDMNATVSSVNVKRYILISSGDALVGNVGGLNSGVEITALGPPVNFLSRLDDATKDPNLAKFLEPGDLVLCESSAATLAGLGLKSQLAEIDLKGENVTIRDFPEVAKIYILRPTEETFLALMSQYQNAA
jgi:class 3 adenylate cyclase